ncbi:hypothetical protein K474DRAFT_486616 [Panus rudis PR-1116 ss-1]|nr:hypothetical protein K474DRAFT_486616 [Panus rudis PR-1116 ss-1]
MHPYIPIASASIRTTNLCGYTRESEISFGIGSRRIFESFREKTLINQITYFESYYQRVTQTLYDSRVCTPLRLCNVDVFSPVPLADVGETRQPVIACHRFLFTHSTDGGRSHSDYYLDIDEVVLHECFSTLHVYNRRELAKIHFKITDGSSVH